MTGLGSLWLPILAAAIGVFVASSLIHMVIGWHHTDHRHLAQQDQVLDALRPFNIPPGDYFLPRPASRGESSSPEFAEKAKRGPMVVMTVLRSGMPMGKNLAMWFVYCVVVGLFAAYITGRALPPGAEAKRVFQFTGATAFMGYALALWQQTIWYQRALLTTVKSTIDGLVYGVVTAGVFAWLWPR